MKCVLQWLNPFWLGGGLVALCCLAGCGKREAQMGPVVARVGEAVISVADLERELARRGSAATAEQREAALQDLIRTQVLFQRAREAGFDREAETEARVRRVIASAYEEKLRGPEKVGTNSLADVEAYHQAHAQEFRAPERVRAAGILLRAPRKAEEEKRREVLAQGEKILADAKSLPAGTLGFGDLARQFSGDQTTRYQGGDLGWISREEAEARFGGDAAKTLFEMKEAGELRGPIAVADGVMIFKLMQREEARIKPLSVVREVVAYRVRQAREAEDAKAFEEKLRGGLKIEIDRGAVESVKVVATNPPPTPPNLQGR